MTQQPASRTTPTSADVARRAGVSRATVSYVLNDSATGRVSEQTRKRVREAAEELGYVPHAAARALRAGHTGIVLLTMPELVFGPLFNSFLTELRNALRTLGYPIAVYADSGTAEAAASWAELRPTAVLVGAGSGITPRGVELLRRSGTRAVLTIGGEPVEGAHSLMLDQIQIGTVAAAHLLSRGHRRIGAIVPADPGLGFFSRPRLEGLRAAYAEHGGPGSRVEPLPLDYTEQSAAQLAAGWRESGLSALFTYNDEYALLLLSAFQDAGLRIPEDVALVGADDVLLARLTRPRLTTVRLEIPDGARLAQLIDRLIRNPDTPPELHTLGASHIVVRDSG
ncbi:LacI family transcriptional regulator [Streptacidiphilus sp. 4-A2]|nr:LacI family transcriptional regulator [Streptacidiphilus sp. 4-A2]